MQDFETDILPWEVSTAPNNYSPNNWERITAAGFPEGPAIRTPNSVYLGFGFEAIDSMENRDLVMERIMNYIGQ